MNYIKLFILIVVLSQVGGWTSEVFAQVYLEGCLNEISDDGLCTRPTDGADASAQYQYHCGVPPWDAVTQFTQYKLGFSVGGTEILDGNTSGVGLCNGSFQPHANIGGDLDYDGEEFVWLSLYSPNDTTLYGHVVFQKISGDGTMGGDWIVLDEIEGSILPDSTRIVSYIPPENTTVATGTQAVGFNGYVNFDDFYSGDDAYYTYTLSSPLNTVQTFTSGSVDIGTFGAFQASTTQLFQGSGLANTILEVTGTWTHTACIYYGGYTFLGIDFGYESVCDTGTFIVSNDGLETLYDDWVSEFQAGFASTTAQIGTTCNPVSLGTFNIALCLSALVIPPTSVLVAERDQLRAIPPWGYGFRLYDIMNGTASSTSTSTLPVLTYDFGTTSVMYALGLTNISFDPFGTLEETGNIVNTVSDQTVGKTVEDIFRPVVTLIVYLTLAFMILRDIGIIKWQEWNEEADAGLSVYSAIAKDKIYHDKKQLRRQIHRITRY